jgi:hypothetical protein
MLRRCAAHFSHAGRPNRFTLRPNPSLAAASQAQRSKQTAKEWQHTVPENEATEPIRPATPGTSSPRSPRPSPTGAGRGVHAARVDRHAENDDAASARAQQIAFEAMTSRRAQRNPLMGRPPLNSIYGATTSGEEHREAMDAAFAGQARGEGPAGLAEDYHSIPRPDGPTRGRLRPGEDPDQVVDNYIPVAPRVTDYNDSASKPRRTFVSRVRMTAEERLHARLERHGVKVALEGEDAVEPGTAADATAHAAYTGADKFPSKQAATTDRGVTVSAKSALYRSVINPLPLASREGRNTWNTLRVPSEAVNKEVEERSTEEELVRSQGHYTDKFERTSLEHQREAVQYSTSVYTKQALVVDGVSGYHNFLSRQEEKDIMAELMKLLQTPGASAFQPEEGRHCVNLFEKRLGVPTHDAPLVFGIAQDAPVLHGVLHRAFAVGLIPSPPNVVQVSEYVSPFGGYRPHLKHRSIGQYVGVLSLVSDSLMVLQHIDQNWTPQIDVVARSMYVVAAPALFEYRLGYPDLDRSVRTHKFRSRMTKDYRIEVLFATADAATVPALAPSVKLTEAAEKRGLHELAAQLRTTKPVLGPAGGPQSDDPDV